MAYHACLAVWKSCQFACCCCCYCCLLSLLRAAATAIEFMLILESIQCKQFSSV